MCPYKALHFCSLSLDSTEQVQPSSSKELFLRIWKLRGMILEVWCATLWEAVLQPAESTKRKTHAMYSPPAEERAAFKAKGQRQCQKEGCGTRGEELHNYFGPVCLILMISSLPDPYSAVTSHTHLPGLSGL